MRLNKKEIERIEDLRDAANDPKLSRYPSSHDTIKELIAMLDKLQKPKSRERFTYEYRICGTCSGDGNIEFRGVVVGCSNHNCIGGRVKSKVKSKAHNA